MGEMGTKKKRKWGRDLYLCIRHFHFDTCAPSFFFFFFYNLYSSSFGKFDLRKCVQNSINSIILN